ncbi:MAG: alpha/beta hydrolase [Myxococcota bacterium]|nr:alpha/beta hydrolase [Myxococcota bacterium]
MAADAELRFLASEKTGEVSALLRRPRGARWLYVLAHGAGADMRHRFMEDVSEGLAGRGVATFRFQFPYTEKGRRGPDRRDVLVATVRGAVAAAAKEAGGLPLLAGGKSMGGRMTSLAAAEAALPGVKGLVFLGFPLHAPGKPSTGRGDHLAEVDVPMLFLQGTRDKLADLELLRPVCRELGRRATLHEVEGGDHSFHVLKRSGRNDAEVREELLDAIDAWTAGL